MESQGALISILLWRIFWDDEDIFEAQVIELLLSAANRDLEKLQKAKDEITCPGERMGRAL